ncbi:choice-of-anchor D domain-containing protein [Flavobacterium sp. CYK-55]|uniref:T9SS type A sorting domain-containing protein n=1 Tax=Flavobacterium sp. CYK-55 TaxID=2835529 RepID=UPI001BCD1887|nr:choice-of-anchor D domain-containing protein [Flavobacterium sp. CYK-55]MBS7787485.1 choice-of-anchor D domain-containing protein [Flavobacterium sp. CYK-55]
METTTLQGKKFLWLCIILLIAAISNAQSTQTYSTSGSFNPPAGVSSVTVELWGAGGGGASGTTASGGGGGGAYTRATLGVSHGTAVPFTVGAGGAVGASGTSTTMSGVTANGGAPGSGRTGGAGGAASAIVAPVTLSRSGGNGGAARASSGGANNEAGGGGGGSATSAAAGGNGSNGGTSTTVATAGGSGQAIGGLGAAADGNPVATIGNAPGSGGGGRGEGASSSMAGANGQVIISWVCPSYSLTSATTATGPLCGSGSTSTVTIRSNSMPSGTYTITYNLTGATTATGSTALVTFASGTPGTGTFTTSALNVGTTNITITNISSNGFCSAAIGTNNTASVNVVSAPTAVAGTAVSTCSNSGAVNICAGANATFYTAFSWSSSGTGTLTSANSLSNCTYTPSAADIAAGSVTLTLSVTGSSPCGVVTSNKTLTITAAPTANAGTAINTCYNSGAVNITAGRSAANYSSIQWTSSGTGTFANANNLTTCTYTPSAADIAAGSVTITLTANGTAPCSNATSNKTLTIQPGPTSNAGTDVYTCNTGAAVNITAGATATNYSSVQWTTSGILGTLSNATSLTNCTYAPSAVDLLAGSVTLTLTVTGNAPCGGTAVSNKTLYFNSPSTVDAGTAVSTCSASGAVNITAGSSATNQASVLWTSSGTGVFSNATSLTTCTYTPSAADVSAGSVILTLTAVNPGCGNVTDTKTLSITPSVVASVSISASATTICGGTSVTFTATPTNGGATPTYQWRVNGSSVGTNSTTYTSTTLANGDVVTCVMTATPVTCLAGSPATSNAITMSVTTPLAASVVISTASTSVCAGNTITFTATPTNGGATPTYQWKVNGSNVGTNSATYSTGSLANGNIVTCVMTSSLTCVTGSPATSNALTMTVNPYATASVSITATATTICSGTSVTFTATPTNGGSTPSYQWTLNGTNVGTNSTTYTSSTLTHGDQVICIMTSSISSCLLGSPASSNTVTMTVNNTPSITGTTPGARTGTGTVVLGATSSGGGTVFWYSTSSGGGAIGSGNSFTTPSISTTTTYYAVAVSGAGCASSPRTAVVATVYAPEMDVQGNLVSIADGDTTPAVADWTNFNGASTRTFTIFNTGTGILNIGTISFSGINASEYSISVPPNTSVAAGDNTSFTVQFTPTAAGARTATISIANDDANENPYDFALTGTGTAQEINIQGNTNDIVDGDTTPTTTDWTDFSTVSTTRTFTIQNTGSITLNITGITFGGTNPGDFSIISSPSATVAGRTSTTFTVKFTAGGVGVRSAIINIANNDASENPYNFTIQGTGSTINMNVKAVALLIADNDTTPSAADWTDFGTTNVSSPISRTYTVENTGTSALSLTGTPRVALSGSTDFSVTVQPAASVAASSTTTFTVTFNPTSTGIKNATVSIANNDPGASKNPYTFAITGTGLQAFSDTDGDGAYNHLDSDDDNDGIPDNVEQSYASGSVLGTQVQMTLLNETFGSGTTRADINDFVSSATTTYCYEDGTSAITTCDTAANVNCDDGQYTVYYESGSTAVASWAPTYWYQGVDHTPSDTNGRMAIFNATNKVTEEFYRTVMHGVITNAPLTYGFWVINLDRSDAPSIDSRNRPNITVEIRDLSNTIVSSLNTGDIAPTTAGNLAGNWFYFSNTFTPTQTGYSIVFRNNQLGGSGNDLALDDIRIVQLLTDTDQDGTADAYDLDSDNDGIGDINEDLWTAYSNGKDRMDLSGGTWVDANTNGFHDTAEAYYNSGGTPKNTDGDAVPNYIDLDSDNDSIFDVDECGLTNGDGDVNGDGAGDGADADADGILTVFDSLSGFGNTGKSLPTNTLGTGNADYLKVIARTAGVYDISSTLYASLDANNDGKIDGTADIDKDGILDAFDTNTNFYGSPRDLDRKLLLDFDGRNDYGQGTGVLSGLANASLMAWIDLGSGYSSDGVIVGQNNFHIRVNNSRRLEVVANGTTLTYSTALSTNQWYHVGATYGGGTLKLYLNGAEVNSAAVAGSLAADATSLTLGKDPSTSTKYFKGKIDEVRVFNVALTASQFQRMVYQEIQNSSSQVRGLIVPVDVGSLPFTNVLRYYRMDAYKNDIIDDLTTASIDTGTGMKIYNHKNIYTQQAPMPFVTERDGSFATAVNSPTNEVRGQDAMDQDWSIIQVQHNITETANSVDLGLIVDSGKTVTMNNDTKLQNDWYLLLNGKIDLQGKSQLLQTTNSVLDATGTGSIERDQQGQSNKFNYNYWCSPVGTINSVSNNNSYTVSGVMRDGTDPNNLKTINWTTGYNGSAATSPITLSSYWIYKFQNLTPQYANWSAVGQNGTLLAAQGYTLKGSDAGTASQNYTFVGKPNSGTITTVIAPGNLNLAGNPYPSALDANAFITANSSSITGSLYFWEHYSTNSSHNLLDYQGGYSARNLVGGTPPVAPSGISGEGSSSRTPGRFIPVGQGFLVYGSSTGGTITFNNSQRAFVKEDDATSNYMYRQANQFTQADPAFDNREDSFVGGDTFARIRLGFDSANNYHRQILLGFMDNLATEGFDFGYDAVQIDTQPNDLYFKSGSNNLVIQGVGAFNANRVYPLSLKNTTAGDVKFKLDDVENLDANQNIYIKDNVTGLYHNIRNQDFQINLATGIYADRFSLCFSTSPNLGVDDFNENEEVIVSYTNNDSMINITKGLSNAIIKDIELINMLGQNVKTWNVENNNGNKIQIPVTNISTGAYIVKVTTSKGDLTKKIIIK